MNRSRWRAYAAYWRDLTVATLAGETRESSLTRRICTAAPLCTSRSCGSPHPLRTPPALCPSQLAGGASLSVDLLSRLLGMTEHRDVVATRNAYDTVAVDYGALLRDEWRASRWTGRCSPRSPSVAGGRRGRGGRPRLRSRAGTVHLAGLGVDAFGIDLSPAMIEVARETYPGTAVRGGHDGGARSSPDAALGGAVAWYSIIHTPPERQHDLFAEFARVCGPGAGCCWRSRWATMSEPAPSRTATTWNWMRTESPDRIRSLATGFTAPRLVRARLPRRCPRPT